MFNVLYVLCRLLFLISIFELTSIFAQELIKNRSKFLNERSDSCYEYKNKNISVYEIVISSEYKCPECTYCSCPYFLDRAICKHKTMVCIKKKLPCLARVYRKI